MKGRTKREAKEERQKRETVPKRQMNSEVMTGQSLSL
jgi:hypothetical protein